jgi:RAB protein geranylgeranyltransferase component A
MEMETAPHPPDDDQEAGYLKAHYDVIICGTGLVESIVSCAASRCGLEVLHLDRNNYYGSNFATFNLKEFLSLTNDNTDQDQESVVVDDTHMMDGGEGKPHLGFTRVIPLRTRLSARTMTAPPTPDVLSLELGDGPRVNSASNLTLSVNETSSEGTAAAPEPPLSELETLLQTKYRRFSMDLNAKFLFAAGLSVDYFVKSGVANYLEFKSMDGITYVDKNEVFPVPSSKSDMFNSKFFNPAEKRIMTKFMLFVADYGRASAGTDLKTLNEKQLAQGRMLHRPQNKETTVHEYDVDSYLNRPFRDFMTHCKIPPRLQTIIVHALCFHIRSSAVVDPHHVDSGLDTQTALQLLSTHLTATGRYGDTALLWPIYGASEIPQAFCRMSAVWGAIFLLRTHVTDVRELDAPTLPWNNNTKRGGHGEDEEGNELDAEADPDAAVATARTEEEEESPAVDATVLPEESSRSDHKLLQVTISTGKRFTCNAFISSSDEFTHIRVGDASSTVGTNGCFEVVAGLINCVVICSLKDIDSLPLTKERSIEIFPPMVNGINNPHAMYFIQSDASCHVCPDGTALLHIVTQVDVGSSVPAPSSSSARARKVVVAGTASEQSSASSSAGGGNDVQSWEDFVFFKGQEFGDMMNRALDVLGSLHRVQFIAQKMFIRPLFGEGPSAGTLQPYQQPPLFANIAVTGDRYRHYQMSTDDVVQQASKVFARLLPGKEFMHQAELDPDFRSGMSGSGFSNPLENMDDEMEYLARTLNSTVTTSAETADAAQSSDPDAAGTNEGPASATAAPVENTIGDAVDAEVSTREPASTENEL